jgi:hypothetical protein
VAVDTAKEIGGDRIRSRRGATLRGAVLVVAGALIGSLSVVAVQARHDGHPRDEYLFLYYARAQTVQDEQTRVALLAEGDRACQWIATQPLAPDGDTSGRFESGRIGNRYAEATAAQPLYKGTAEARSLVAVEAWGGLCFDISTPHIAAQSTGD